MTLKHKDTTGASYMNVLNIQKGDRERRERCQFQRWPDEVDWIHRIKEKLWKMD